MDNDEEQWIAQLRKGTLELCMLALLVHEQRYGYQIAQGLIETAGLAVSEGTIYPLLSRLQREGLVESHWHESPAGPPRKYYRLTDAGHRVFKSQATIWEKITRSVDIIIEEARNGESTS